MLLHTNEEALRKIEQIVEIEEYLMAGVPSQCTCLFQFLLEGLQILKVMDVITLGLHELFEDMLPLSQFDRPSLRILIARVHR